MKIAAVIAEYNPLHHGHFYQYTKIKKDLQTDYILVIMSGDYVQRGTPAILDKYTRAGMALAAGADLVIELPVYYALGSAEFFAKGAVTILDRLHCIDYLHFGSECGNISLLKSAAQILLEEPAPYKETLSSCLRDGLSFPVARMNAFTAYQQQSGNQIFPEKELQSILTTPNNILGIEYCKILNALHSSIQPVTISREGLQYHEQSLDSGAKYPSASSLRAMFQSAADWSSWEQYIPAKSYQFLTAAAPVPLVENDFSGILYYKLLSEPAYDYTAYFDVSRELSNKIKNSLQQFTSFTDFCLLLKSRNYTYTRIARCLFHILLNIKTEDIMKISSVSDAHYVRILGFRQESTPLLSCLKENSTIPLISKLTQAPGQLSDSGIDMLNADLYAHQIYQSVITTKSGLPARSEYTQQIIRY